ncbi:MAG: RDD family protein [Xanthomonadales bacterium]|nr:RDD family protein [Xanthomonadales bacterium]
MTDQTPPPLPEHNPYAAPAARVQDVPVDTLELADRGTRLVAVIIDSLLVMGVGLAMGIMAPLFAGRGGSEAAVMVVVSIGLALFLALIALNLVWLYRYGQTIAKRWMGIKIVRSSGERCELWRIIVLRVLPLNLLSAIPFIGYVVPIVDGLCIFRSDYRCVHDLLADTIVVKA